MTDSFAQNLITLFETIHPLDQVPRAGFLLRGVANPESVAAHSHFVSLMTLLFVEQYPDRFDAKRALSMALTHDLAEAKLMDIPMPAADAYLKEAKHNAEQSIMDDLLEPLPGKLAALHQELENPQTEEAKLLRGLDKAQMMLKVMSYERENRGDLEEFWNNPKNFADYGIEPVSKLFDALCKKANRTRPQ